MEILKEFFNTSLFKVLVSAFLALIPVFIWISIYYKKNDHESKDILFVFFLGTLTVLPILGFELLWLYHPEFDIYEIINHTFKEGAILLLVTYMLAGVVEEIVKGVVIYYIDFSSIQIKTINNCIKYNILVALGFAFSENILYFYSGIMSGDLFNLFAVFIFRSIFTVAGHTVFSSITGYYYGLSKFTDPIIRQEKWEGRTHKITMWIAHNIGRDPRSILPKVKLWTGLLIAMIMHGSFNISLATGHILFAILIVVIGFLYVLYLRNRNAGNLVLALTGTSRKSMMTSKDEDVVLELLGMYIKQKKYKEVQEISERLLKRDPDNRVVKLFLAKAKDHIVLKGKLKELLKK